MLQITSKPIGMGKQRMCYVHPEDPRLAIKIASDGLGQRSQRELRFYQGLKNGKNRIKKHLPKIHGVCDTNLGQGLVVDLVRSYDGEIARPLNWYLALGFPIEEFESSLAELYQAFVADGVVFRQDLSTQNLLFRKTSAARGQLVVINGFGDDDGFDWRRLFPFLLRRRIHRDWEAFIDRVYHSREVSLQREAMAKHSVGD